MSLPTLLVQRQIASQRDIDEACSRQQLLGGDLVTSLLEICDVDEERLLPVLAEAFGIPPGPAGELPRPTDRRILSKVTFEQPFAPLAMRSDSFVIAVAEPLSPKAQQALSFWLACPVAQRLTCAVRIKEALARDYGLSLDARSASLLHRLQHRRSSAPHALSSKSAGHVHASDSRLVHVEAETDAPNGSELHVNVTTRASTEQPTTKAPRALEHPLRWSARRGPSMPSMTLREALNELDRHHDRDAIFATVFDFFRHVFEAAVLFVVHGNAARGRGVFGPQGQGASVEEVLRMEVSLAKPSLLSLARERGRVVQKIPEQDGLDAILAADLERDVRVPWCVVPIRVRDRVVGFVVGDCAGREVDASRLQEAQCITERASHAFERIILRRRAEEAPDSMARAFGEHPRSAQVTGPPPPPQGGRRLRSKAPPLEFGSKTTPPSGFDPATFAVETPRGRFAHAEMLVVAPSVAAVRPQPNATAPTIPVQVSAMTRTDTAAPHAPTLVDFNAVTPPGPQVEGVSLMPTRPAIIRSSLLSSARGSSAPVARSSMPVSEQQVSVAPHRPPPSYNAQDEALPSVIVDRESEHRELVERLLQGTAGGDEEKKRAREAESVLLRAGKEALTALMSTFPGPIAPEVERLEFASFPRASECGQLLRVLAGLRQVALPSVLARLNDADERVRFWATYLLTELVYSEAVDALTQRIFDDRARVRQAACAAIRALAEVEPVLVVSRLETLARSPEQSRERRARAIEALGETKEVAAVPALLVLLEDPSSDVMPSVLEALGLVTRQSFGTSAVKWQSWWAQNHRRHRLEWLIDALMHDEPSVRAAASEELKTTTKEYFGYYDELPKRERERAQARYREWWGRAGSQRFERSRSLRGQFTVKGSA